VCASYNRIIQLWSPIPDGRGELNKLASNIAMGHNLPGIHWRSDYAESLKLGEAVTISILRDQRLTYQEDFGGYTFTKTVTV
jgi:hypothetical protein